MAHHQSPSEAYPRRLSSSSSAVGRASRSPVASIRPGHGGSNGEMNGHAHALSTSPRPAPTSRMALSALVNSPPPPMRSRSPPRHASSSNMPYPSSSYSSYPPQPSYPHSHPDPYSPTHPVSSSYPSYSNGDRDRMDRSDRERVERIDRTDRGVRDDRSYSHDAREIYPDERTIRSRAYSNGTRETPRVIREMVPTPSLQGGEDVWNDALREYQKQREVEALEIAELARSHVHGMYQAVDRSHNYQAGQDAIYRNGQAYSNGNNHSSYPDTEATANRRARAEDDLLAAASDEPPQKKSKKSKPKRKVKSAAIEAELLDLLEGDTASSINRSSPAPPASDPFGEDEEDRKPVTLDTVFQPSNLTLAQIVARIQAKEKAGLSKDELRAGDDEIWKQQKVAEGGVPLNKDGTMRKKPGPAKGFKFPNRERRPGSMRGDNDSEAGDTSIAGGSTNGEVDADIAGLLFEDTPTGKSKTKAKAKRRPVDVDESVASLVDGTEEGSVDDTFGDAALSLLEDGTPGGSKKKKARSTGVGKGNWQRPVKEDKDVRDFNRKAEVLAVQNAMQGSDMYDNHPGYPADYAYETMAQHPEILPYIAAPNTEDPRGVSETEAKIRLGLAEDLQKLAWASIVKDIPKNYRVYQACDQVMKQDCLRKAQSAVRNAATRYAKPTAKTTQKINRDAVARAKRVTKELMTFWKKNEKDEMIAKKKAEKEALEKAKAEEEAREAKRQSRKLNFLLTQTELYSHFIGKKIKTKEAEGEDAEDGTEANEDLGLDASGEPLPDLDYDDDDEENLRRHAARGAQAAIKAAKDKAQAFDRRGQEEDLDMDGDELNFQNPTLAADSVTIEQPKMLMAQLKEYQLKGLTWLGNLYEQGINGILADEMGLGKTIQSISLLAYLAEHHGIWGPFLVIAPASTLHNWQQELARFVPRLKAIPYWGTADDRKILRKPWYKKTLNHDEDTMFHIVVTSYDIAVIDASYLATMRWQYMILDEAQAIKSSSSMRWKSLLSFNCRNRLLLTGTPIQNSMHELWALLHFIMPSLFDSHEEFSEWFSKDIENAAGGGASGSLKPEQLRRLHMILKPFMLRRVKKHVQKELGDKIEIDVLVDISQRQRSIYKALRQRVSISDLIAQANNLNDSSGAKNLMNLVMQFRKVCNHPDLFERADVVSPFMFGTFSQSGNLLRQDGLYCPDSAHNAIEVTLPKLIWTDGGVLDRPSEDSPAGSDTKVMSSLMNIWKAGHIQESLKSDDSDFGFLKVMGHSPSEVEKKAKSNPLIVFLEGALEEQRQQMFGEFEGDCDFAASRVTPFVRPPKVPSIRLSPTLPALTDITSRAWNTTYLSRADARFAIDSVVAPYIKPAISSTTFTSAQARLASEPLLTRAIYGLTPSERDDPRALAQLDNLVPGVGPRGLLGASPYVQAPFPSMRVPPIKRLIVDSAKLARLDELLRELKAGGHRVLLYFQMTKMMDLMEEYLIYRQYKYLRLDGSSPIGERRDMVTSWQTNPDIFVFCLSTRAGGLGINLTAADTVIFYDHDWNPSNDAQAMDRAHRVGQTKQVTVYRLIARGTIEERILQLARAKKDVQDIVVGTKSLTDVAKPSEIVSLFMDDEELAESVAKRKQAEAHGYVAPQLTTKPKSSFGDNLGTTGDDDEDDFFSLKRKVPNAEDEEGAVDDQGTRGVDKGKKKSAAGGAATGKRKTPGDSDDKDKPKKPSKKRVKMALGPDGLPL